VDNPAVTLGVAPTNLSEGSPYPPGEPLRPMASLVPPDLRPRQWGYQVGYNIAQMPRATEETSFESLRALAEIYDGVQLCERVYFDYLTRLQLCVTPRAELLDDGEDAKSPRWRDTCLAVSDALESPDGVQDLRSWLVAFVRDLLELDAVAIYRRRDRAGRLYGLELVNGASIKPLIEAHGRIPQPPQPAYQQFLYGVPGGRYTLAQMDYLRETPRTDSPYGLSRVERIIIRVNQALRKQNFDLTRFTDGVTPLGIIEPPATLTWTLEQLRLYERVFNGMLAGQDAERVRARALPPGAKWQSVVADDPLVDFDRFLLNLTVAAFGLTMDELGFTDNSNRSVGASQEAVVYRRAILPVVTLISNYLTRVVRQEIDPRLTVGFTGFEEPEDFAARAEALARLIPTGTISPSAAARALKLPVGKETPAYLMLPGMRAPLLVDDLIAGKITYPLPQPVAVGAGSGSASDGAS
jgi:hypothetical protein